MLLFLLHAEESQNWKHIHTKVNIPGIYSIDEYKFYPQDETNDRSRQTQYICLLFCAANNIVAYLDKKNCFHF